MKLEKDLIARMIVCLVALINAIAAIFGFNPLGLEEETIYSFVSTSTTTKVYYNVTVFF